MTTVCLTWDCEAWPLAQGWPFRGIPMGYDFKQSLDTYLDCRTTEGALGLDFHLAVLRQRGLVGTFLFEASLSRTFFQMDFAEAIGRAARDGHEVGLHLHSEPFGLLHRERCPESAIGAQTLSLIDPSLLREEIDLAVSFLAQASGQRIRSFRAGNFGLDRAVIPLLAECGFEVDSSLNPSMPLSMLDVPDRHTIRVPSAMDGLTEAPVTTFLEPRGRTRHMQICAVSLSEMVDVLEQAAEFGYPVVTLFLHPFELVDVGTRLRGNALRSYRYVTDRFVGLCDFLARHKDHFPTAPLSSAAALVSQTTPPQLRIGTADWLARQFQQVTMRRRAGSLVR